jgi:hypothetical protein
VNGEPRNFDVFEINIGKPADLGTFPRLAKFILGDEKKDVKRGISPYSLLYRSTIDALRRAGFK